MHVRHAKLKKKLTRFIIVLLKKCALNCHSPDKVRPIIVWFLFIILSVVVYNIESFKQRDLSRGLRGYCNSVGNR